MPRRRFLFFALLSFAGVGFLLVAGSAEATPLSGANADMNKMCTHNLTGYSTRTASANDVVASDVLLGNNALDTGADFDYYGMTDQFQRLAINVGTAGVGGTQSWTYWNGASWAALTVTDNTNHFLNSGVNTVLFTPPGDWATTTVDATLCTGTYYFVRSETGTDYTTLPRATQISAVQFNLKVKVQDELSNTLTSLASTAFILSGGTTNTVYTYRDLGSGLYELALDTVGADRNFNLQVQKDGYVTSATAATGTLSATLTDLSGTPHSLKFAVKIVPDEETSGRTAITGATVTTGDSYGVTCVEPSTPDGNYYCAVPVAHTETSVKIVKDGYVTKTLSSAFTDRSANSASQQVGPQRVALLGGNLPSARTGTNAVYDANGKNIYIFGGNDGSRSSEIVRYNPANDQVQTMSATLPTARDDMAAVWDSTNNVAYLFGGNDGSMLTDILKYNPSTDTLSDTGLDLPSARDRATAAWDSTNNVAYIFGGWTSLPATEIIKWDPAGDGTVTTMTSTLPLGRTGATAIYDGTNFYIFGGWNVAPLSDIIKCTASVASCSTLTAVLPSTIEDARAVYVDPYVYLYGGWTGTANTDDIVEFRPSNSNVQTLTAALPSVRKKTSVAYDSTNANVYIMGGDLASGKTDEIVKHNPSGGTVGTTPVLTSRRIPGAAVYYSSNIYLFGGWDGSSTRYADVTKFVPATKAVTTQSATFSSAREGVAAAAVGSNVYIFGGYTGSAYLDAIVKYDTEAGTLTTLSATLPSGRAYASAVSDGTYVYVLGGQTGGASYTNQILRFNPSGSGSIETLSATLPATRSYMSAIWDGSNVYTFGGQNSGIGTTAIYRFSPSSGTATTMSAVLPSGNYWTSAIWDGSNAYIFGGSTASKSDDILQYSTSADTITNMDTVSPNDKLPTNMYGTVAAWDSVNSKTYIFGGEDSDAVARVNKIHRYDRNLNLDFQYAFKVTSVATEGPGTSLTSVTVKAGNSQGTTCTESSGAWYCAVPKDDTTLTIQAAKDGYDTYVGSSFGSDRTAHTDAQVSGTVSGVPFAYKVTAITTEGPAASITSGATVKAGNSFGTTCTEYSSAWYCPVPLADTSLTIQVAVDGYDTYEGSSFGSDRTAATDNQVTGSVSGVLFAFKVTGITTEGPGASLTSATVKAGNSFGTTCTESSGAWYCAVPLADTSLTIQVEKDGYDTWEGSSFGSDRTLATDNQVTAAVSGVQFAFKVTGITTEGPAASLTSATVKAGNSFGTTCTESSGAWYCAVPLADTSLTIQVEKDGYDTWEGSSFDADRTAHANDQKTKAVSGVQFAYKVTGITTEGPGTSLTSATVKAGDSFGTTCTESSGAWYCAVPKDDASLTIQVAKDGYDTWEGTSFDADRTAHTANQQTKAVSGVQFAFKVTGITTEGPGTSLTSATVKAGNSQGTTCTESSGAWYCPVPLADTTLTIQAEKDGYKTYLGSSFGSDRTAATDNQVTAAVSGIQFAFKVTGITTEGPAASLTSATLKAGNSFGTTCTESSGAWYCPVPLADTTLTIQAAKDGYDTYEGSSFASDRTAATDNQVTAAVSGIQFAYKVTSVADELGTSLTTVTVKAGNSQGTTCTESSGAWYCAVPLADTTLSIQAAKDGYVTSTGSNAFGSDRTAATDNQVTGTFTALPFAFKVTSVATEASATLTTGTLKTGNSYGTTCSSSGGAWYCAVPLADTGVTIEYSKDGYVTNTGNSFSSDRTSATDAQVTKAATAIQYTVKLTVSGETSLTGVEWEKKLGAGSYAGVSYTDASGNVAYFAQTTSEADVVFRATKNSLQGESGAALTASASSQIARTITLATCTSNCRLMTETANGASLVAGATTTYTFTVQSPTTWPANGKFAATFPSGYTIGSPTVTLGVATGTATASVSGQTVTVTRANDGVLTAAEATITIALTAITNPTVSGSSGTFSLLLEENGGTDLASDPADALTITAGALVSPSASASSLTAGATGTYTFAFTNANPWPANGKVVIALPTGYSIGSPSVTLTGATGTATASVSGTTFTVTRANDGAQTAASTAITVALTAVTNPNTSGATGTFTLTTRTTGDVDIDAGTASAVTIVPGTITVTASAANYTANVQTTYTFSFTAVNPWPADGKLEVTFPSSYSISSPSATLTGATGTATTSVSSTTVTLTRANDGAQTTAGTAVTVALTQVTNPSSSGSSGTFTLTLQNSAGTSIDTGVAAAVTVTSNSLTITGLTSSTHPAATWKVSTSFSVSWTAPSSSVSGYSWGFDSDPDDAVDGTSTSTTVSGVGSGTHNFKVKAKSSAGTWGPVATYSDVYVDAVAPTTPSITSSTHAASTCSSSTSGAFAWSASDATSGLDASQPYGYSLDGASETRTNSASFNPTGLQEGSHTLSVTAYDRAGNKASSSYAFRVDTQAPTATLTSPTAYTNAASVALPWSASENCGTVATVSVEFRHQDGTWQPHSSLGTSSSSPSGTLTVQFALGDGKYDFRIRATDSSGNTGAFPNAPQGTTTLDRVAPGAPTKVNAAPQPGGYIRVSWSAATDDRSGIAGYNVYRVDRDATVKVNGALVTATEYLDGPYPHGSHLKYEVRAVDRAGNAGSPGASPQATVQSQGPQTAPNGLTAVGLADGILDATQVRLTWEAVTEAYDYAIYRDGVLIGSSKTTSFDVPEGPEGQHTYVVVARDSIGNEGPPASINFLKDGLGPTSRAGAPAESGPAVLVTWTSSDAGIGVAKVELWVLEDGQENRRFYGSTKTEGSVSFYGIEGHTYYFISIATDGIGHTESKTLQASRADASTKVVGRTATASAQTVQNYYEISGTSTSGGGGGGGSSFVGGSGGGGGGGGGPVTPFYADDTNADGVPETFVDPNGKIASARLLADPSGDLLFVLESTSGGSDGAPTAMWSPATNQVLPITVFPEITQVNILKQSGGRLSATAVIEQKQGWIYIPVKDIAPDRSIVEVQRKDGSLLPPTHYWRSGEYVVVMDDPTYEYHIIYGPAPVLVWEQLGLIELIFLGVFVAAAIWIEWPSVNRLRAHPPRRASLAWGLRHCGDCNEALPRAHRLLRPLHLCSTLIDRVGAGKHWWHAAAFSDKVSISKRVLDSVSWLAESPPSVPHSSAFERLKEFLHAPVPTVAGREYTDVLVAQGGLRSADGKHYEEKVLSQGGLRSADGRHYEEKIRPSRRDEERRTR